MEYQPDNSNEDISAKIPALALLTKLGYQFIAPHTCNLLRSDPTSSNPPSAKSQKASAQVMLLPVMREFLASRTFFFAGQQHSLTDAAIDKILAELSPAMNLGLMAANEKLYNAMLYGVTVTEFIDGKKASPTIALIDWETPDNNYFHVTEEMVVQNSEGTGTRRPDIVCFVNGLPWVVMEAKRPDSDQEGKSTCRSAISQHLRNQGLKEIPHLFAYSQLLLAINGYDGMYGTCGTIEKFWAIWRETDISESEFFKLKNQPLTGEQMGLLFAHRKAQDRADYEAELEGGDLVVTEQDRLLISLLRPDRLLDMTRLYTLFDKKVGKIVARYQQVFSIKAMVARISEFDDEGKRRGGVIWHTTGSGKSFTMVFFSKALIWLEALAKCRLIIVTDRVDLEDQLSGTFTTGGALTDRDQKQARATSGKRLAQQISKGNERFVFSIINKFASAIRSPECYNDSADMIVLVDEGHRSQNGENNIRMQQMLPKAAYIAFTGTPLLKKDKTQNKFGKIIHAYPMQQAVADNSVTSLLYEERIVELEMNEKAIDAWFERMTDGLTSKQQSDLKRQFAQKGAIYKTEGRIELIAHDITDHFLNFKPDGLKGQLACDSKVSAIRYKQALDKVGKVTSAIVISAPDTREGHDKVDNKSKDIVQNWWAANVGKQSEKAYTKAMIAAFEQDGDPDILIVVDKLLTGFDEPKNTVLYIDKSLKSHSLIQAVARVNRLHEAKSFGYLIDYRGILKELDNTLSKYQDLAKRTQNGYDLADLTGLYQRMESEYKKLPALHADLWGIFATLHNKRDRFALRQLLAPNMREIEGKVVDVNLKKRNDFYQALSDFTNCMKVALQSASYFNDKIFEDKRHQYKADLKRFVALRKQVREDANESVEYDKYAEDIKSLLDKHIAGVEVKHGEQSYLVDEMGTTEVPREMGDDEARSKTAAVSGRVTKMIEQELADDPYAQEYFSKMLKKAIEEAKALFDSPVKQYLLFAHLENKVNARKVPDLPASLNDVSGNLNKPAQAYFGLFKHHFDARFLAKADLNDDKLAGYAFAIDEVVTKAVAENSINLADIENAISSQLLTMLYGDLGVEKAQRLIEAVLKVVRLGLSRG